MAAKRNPTHDDSHGIRLEKADDVLVKLDPHLQDVIIASKGGARLDPAVCHTADNGTVVVDVIAKLKDAKGAVPGLNVVRMIGQIATGNVEVRNIESVRKHPNVASLKCSTRVHSDLQFSVPEINASHEQLMNGLPSTASAPDGTGVIVGVVDYGCDFRHRNFLRADGSTRLLFLWDQNGGQTSLSPAGFPFGREFSATAINQALGTPDPNAALAYQPRDGDHGTHVMDIAAGNGSATGARGVASGADLIFVELASNATTVAESFGGSRQLLEAVDYIFGKAAELGRPAVVNLSLGTNGGPHDGTMLVEQGFDTLLQQPGRAIVISAGNAAQHRIHASGVVNPGAARVLGWEIDPTDETGNEVEVWYPGSSDMQVVLIAPGQQRLGPVAPGTTTRIMNGQNMVGRIIHRRHDPNNGANQIDILLTEGVPAGVWGIELQATTAPVSFHAWIERDHRDHQSRFVLADHDPACTVGSISCGADTLVVGSYSALVPARDISSFSSHGPTRDGKHKPEISAPGQGILAARATTQSTVPMSGTSMAAPHVAGLVALLLQQGGMSLTTAAIRRIIMQTARKSPPTGGGWHPRYGEGRIDGLASVLNQLGAVGPINAAVNQVMMPQPVRSTWNGAAAPVDSFVAALADTAVRSNARVRLEIEVVPKS